MSPQESIVYWTEYVIRHNGAPYMRSIGADMPWYQFLLLDIIAAIIIIVILGSYIAVRIIKKLYHFCFEDPKYFISIQIDKKKL